MLIGKSVVSPPHVRTNVIAFLYISLMRVMYLVGTLCFSKAHHMTFLGLRKICYHLLIIVNARTTFEKDGYSSQFAYNKI